MTSISLSLSRILTIGALGTALLAFSAVSASAAANEPRPDSATAEPLTPEHFAHTAAVSGLKEVYAGQLALQKATRRDIKEFAQMMIKDHSQANQRLLALVKDKGYVIPPTNAFELAMLSTDNERQYVREPGTRPGAQMEQPATDSALNDLDRESPGATARQLPAAEVLHVHRLHELSGATFDRAYLREMREDHAKAIQLFEQAQNLKDEEVQRFAKETLPTLQRHAQELQALMQSAPTTRRP